MGDSNSQTLGAEGQSAFEAGAIPCSAQLAIGGPGQDQTGDLHDAIVALISTELQARCPLPPLRRGGSGAFARRRRTPWMQGSIRWMFGPPTVQAFWSARNWLPQQESNLLERFRVGRLSADCLDRVALRQ